MSLLRWVFQKPTLLFGITIACWAVRAGAQAAPSASMNGSYRIAGVVVNAVSGEPVRRAFVQPLKVDDGRAVASSVTDNDGRFALEGLEAAKYQLTASKRGFRTGYYDEHEEFSSAIVTGPDQDTGHLEFRLMPRAVLHGVVTDDGGEPVANARVMLFNRPKHSEAGERITQADAATTDDTGAYELGDLAAGEYLLAVVAEPWYAVHTPTVGKPGANRELDVAYPVTYFDSTTEEQAATPIVLSGGSH
jgi:5-hydroxyisourate hydrolase-like protein (transthyretin family)